MCPLPHAHHVYVELNPQRGHVHPAHADALGPVEPFQPRVRGRVRRRDHNRRKRIVLVAQRPSVAVGTKVEDAAIGAVDANMFPRLETRLDVDDRNSIPADTHPVRRAGQHDCIETRPHEGPLRDVPIDPQAIGRCADQFLAEHRPQ